MIVACRKKSRLRVSVHPTNRDLATDCTYSKVPIFIGQGPNPD